MYTVCPRSVRILIHIWPKKNSLIILGALSELQCRTWLYIWLKSLQTILYIHRIYTVLAIPTYDAPPSLWSTGYEETHSLKQHCATVSFPTLLQNCNGCACQSMYAMKGMERMLVKACTPWKASNECVCLRRYAMEGVCACVSKNGCVCQRTPWKAWNGCVYVFVCVQRGTPWKAETNACQSGYVWKEVWYSGAMEWPFWSSNPKQALVRPLHTSPRIAWRSSWVWTTWKCTRNAKTCTQYKAQGGREGQEQSKLVPRPRIVLRTTSLCCG
jgi:hypothetical protein